MRPPRKLIAVITEPEVIAAVLESLALPTRGPRSHPRAALLTPDMDAPVFEAAAEQIGAELARDEGEEACRETSVDGLCHR